MVVVCCVVCLPMTGPFRDARTGRVDNCQTLRGKRERAQTIKGLFYFKPLQRVLLVKMCLMKTYRCGLTQKHIFIYGDFLVTALISARQREHIHFPCAFWLPTFRPFIFVIEPSVRRIVDTITLIFCDNKTCLTQSHKYLIIRAFT